MVELPHVLVGAAIAVKASNPYLAIPLSFASHFILDLIPHENPSIYTQIKKKGELGEKTQRFVFVDSFIALMVGLSLALFAFPERALLIVICSFFSVLPDVLEIPFYFLKIRTPLVVSYVEFNHKLQSSAPLIPGTVTQLLISAAALWWMFI